MINPIMVDLLPKLLLLPLVLELLGLVLDTVTELVWVWVKAHD